jgi:hypothetical protein
LIVALYNAEKRLKTPKLTTSPPDLLLLLHWGFQDISLGVRFFFAGFFLFWPCEIVDNAKRPKKAEIVTTNLSNG